MVYNSKYYYLQRNLMKKVSSIVILLLLVMSVPRSGYPQSEIPFEAMPVNIPAEVGNNIKSLYSKNPAERVKAASVLGNMGEKAAAAVPFLIRILDDSEIVFQQSGPAVLNSTSPAKEAMFALSKIGGPAVRPLIAVLHNDENTDRRRYAAEALGNIKDAGAIKPLIAALGDRRTIVRDNAYKALLQIIESLRKLQDEQQLIGMLRYHEPSLQQTIIEALGNIPKPRVAETLVPFLGNGDRSVRKDAAEALKRIGKASVGPLMNALQKNDDMQIRINATMILGHLKDPASVGILIESLREKPITPSIEADELRLEAAKALGHIKDTSAIGPLIAALGDETFKVREQAAEALTEIGSPVVEPLIKLLKTPTMHPKMFVAKILGDLKDPRAVEPLIQTLLLAAADRTSWNFRLEAVRALGKIKDPRAAEPLEIMLGDRVPAVREMAEWSLHEISGQTPGNEKEKKSFWKKWF